MALRGSKIKMKDLEDHSLDDFMDPESGPRIWEARFLYFLKKKKAKL